ncbi:hypothetical protein PCE1_002341 [Barthelona sp. PCE]
MLILRFMGSETEITTPFSEESSVATLKRIAARQVNKSSNQVALLTSHYLEMHDSCKVSDYPVRVNETDPIIIQVKNVEPGDLTLADIDPADAQNFVKSRNFIMRNEKAFEQLQSRNSRLAEALAKHDQPSYDRIMNKHARSVSNHNTPESIAIREELEAKQRIDNDYMIRNNELPSSLVPVTMLYINITINNVPVKAFVDTGAQKTIITAALAERCGISKLIDTRFASLVSGVGNSRSLGVIHITQLKLGEDFFMYPLMVLNSPVEHFILGLDFMRQFSACIDLGRKVFVLPAHGVDEEICLPFLGEMEIPKEGLQTLIQGEK